LVEHFIAIVLRFQHKATWYYLHKVLVQLKGIETNDFNRSEVVRIDEIIYKNSKIEGGKGTVKRKGSDGFNWRSAWWIMWIIMMIVRAATCNDRSSKSSYDVRDNTYDPINIDRSSYAEKENEKKFLFLLDSLSKQQNLVITPQKLKTGDQPFKSFADDPAAAINDSVTITNNTGYDAVFLYFKDVPGHGMSALLPKLYSTYIKDSDVEKVYVLPGNGRVYFAFGKGWGKLKNPLAINLNNRVGGFTNSESLPQTITVESFFNTNKNGPQQTCLQLPVFINASDAYRDTTTYHYLNEEGKSSGGENSLHLMQVNGKFTIKAMGRLLVKEKRYNRLD
jgi:hypothetical protein